MNTITPLFASYLYKDIDDNFLDSLEAILYLNPPESHHIEDIINLRLKSGKFGIDVEYNIMDIINLKLIDNFRRIYAFHNKSQLQEKTLKNRYMGATLHSLLNSPSSIKPITNSSNKLQTSLNDLHCQQNKIYKVIEILGDKLVIQNENPRNSYKDNNKKYYKNAVLGKDVEVTTFEMFSYLSLHESLQENNRSIHTQLLQAQSAINKISWNFTSDCLMKIIRKSNTEKAFNTIVENLVENNHINTILNDFELGSLISNDNWTIGVVNYFLSNHMENSEVIKNTLKDKSYILQEKDQLILAKIIVETKMLDLKQFNQLVSDKEQFKEKLNLILNNEKLKLNLEEEFVKAVKPEDILHSKTAKLFLNKIDSLTSPKLLIKTFIDRKLTNNEKQEIAQLYDISNQELIKNVAYAINTKKVDRSVMREFVNVVANNVEKTTLAYIISLHPSYMEFCKPIYMHIRITEKTNTVVPIKENQELNKKLKI